jgi:hypothetical protein
MERAIAEAVGARRLSFFGTNMKLTIRTIIGTSYSRSLVGDLLMLGTIAFVFAILTGAVP